MFNVFWLLASGFVPNGMVANCELWATCAMSRGLLPFVNYVFGLGC